MALEEISDNAAIEASVVEANVCFYRDVAGKYDRYEGCVSDSAIQNLLNRDLDRIGGLFNERRGPIRCLDCGAGTGNLSMKMLERNWSVTVVDVSPDMLALFHRKARDQGFSPRLINDSILNFLTRSNERYDLVTFSSVLHHLYAYLPVVALAVDHLQVEGVFYSNFDPVVSRHKVLSSAFEGFDTSLAKIVHDPSDFFPGTLRRFRKLFTKPDAQHDRPVLGSGDLAEYHAKKGVDDFKIVELLRRKHFLIREHVRWTSGRTAVSKFVNRNLKLMESFKILAQHVQPVP